MKIARLRYALNQAFPEGWIGVALAVLSASLAPFVTSGPPWVMVACSAFFFATLAGYVTTQYSSGGARYDIGPLTITWAPDTNPVPSDEFEKFYREKWWDGRWSGRGYSIAHVHRDGHVKIVPVKPTSRGHPTAPDTVTGRIGIQSNGQHWREAREVVVFHKEALGPTMIHELDLLAAEVAAVEDGPIDSNQPAQKTERQKIEWMKSKGIR